MKSLKEKATTFALSQVIEYLDSDPDKNIPKALDWVEKFDEDGYYKNAYSIVRECMGDPNNVWNHYIKSLYTDIDTKVRKQVFKNFLINSAVLGMRKKEKMAKEHDCNIPWAILMDPTSACNLHCTGCWASEYGDKLSLDFETLDKIITEGKELGVYMYIYSGGEPLVRKKDIIALCEKHHDCQFLSFTNGTLIDEAFADEMVRVGNFIPAISVEGFEEETDMRRGEGTYKAVVHAMEILKEKKLPFGFSTCYHKYNTHNVGSEAYIDKMVELGCKFGWYFTYMPVGKDAPTDLIATAEQRAYMYQQIRKFRSEKPIFTMDFWNDGEFVGGCIAGGRSYLHINANGDIEPCAFIHYSDTNIKEKSLLEALQAPLFMAYRSNQPFNDNHLRPCPLLDNPGRLAEMVEASGAHSTEALDPEDVVALSGKCKEAAENWAPIADTLWEQAHGCENCKSCNA
ncbi:MAG: radical SAM protein [Cellulosilyticaceae bacterium]